MNWKTIAIIFVMGIFVASCAKPECKTRAAKKKRKHYNSIQYR